MIAKGSFISPCRDCLKGARNFLWFTILYFFPIVAYFIFEDMLARPSGIFLWKRYLDCNLGEALVTILYLMKPISLRLSYKR